MQYILWIRAFSGSGHPLFVNYPTEIGVILVYRNIPETLTLASCQNQENVWCLWMTHRITTVSLDVSVAHICVAMIRQVVLTLNTGGRAELIASR